ncbi:hypothetical protein ZWY2020_034855 [Hordeum vulgare]|nr:hypothetical protein ZWY2020_034855 [Hordeum vulgare]
MPSWNDRETSSNDDCQAVSMDMGLLEARDTIVEPLFCGQLELSEPKCILHHMRPLKCVAFEDGKVDRKMNQKQMDDVEVQMEEGFEKKTKEVEEKARLEVQMENLKLTKEQRCILQSQADIIKNTGKATKDVELERNLLKKEKAKLEQVVGELLKDGHDNKEKLEKIQAIIES